MGERVVWDIARGVGAFGEFIDKALKNTVRFGQPREAGHVIACVQARLTLIGR